MKVIFLSKASNIHTVRWVNSLSEKGIEVHLISLPNHEERKENKISNKVKIYYLPIRGSKGYYFNYFSFKKLVKIINPELINVHYASGYGTLARLINFKKTLLNVWGSDIYIFPNESFFKRKILEKNMKKIKYIASTSSVMAKETNKYTSKKIFITPFGVNTQLFKPLKIKKNKEMTIGIVKTLEEKYGVIYLIIAFKKIIDKGYNVKLLIYGEGDLRKKLEELCRTFKISKSVTFKGFIDNNKVPEAINAMDIFCVPSLSESFGVAAVEAMACGIPVISSDAEGLTEVMEDNVTGYIIPKKSSEKIAEKIIDLLKNKKKRKEFGENGRKRVLELYDWNKNVENMLEVYKKITDGV